MCFPGLNTAPRQRRTSRAGSANDDPARYIRGHGWMHQDGAARKPKKMNHAFVWPKDRNRSKLGRIKDLLTGKGPDIYVASNPNRKARAEDGPSRRRWTGFPNAETSTEQWLLDAHNHRGDASKRTRLARERAPYYDFRTRRYRERPYEGMWTDISTRPHERGHQPAAIEVWPNFRADIGHPRLAATNHTRDHDPVINGQPDTRRIQDL